MSQPVSWSSDKPVVFVHQMDCKLFKVEERILLINIALHLFLCTKSGYFIQF